MIRLEATAVDVHPREAEHNRRGQRTLPLCPWGFFPFDSILCSFRFSRRVVAMLFCVATTALAGDGGPQRAAALLGLREHQPVALPDWLAQTPAVWVKTTAGSCVSFANGGWTEPVRLEHILCSVTRRDGTRVEDRVEISLLPAPSPPPASRRYSTRGPRSFSEGGPLLEFDANVSRSVAKGHTGSVTSWTGRLGPWYAVSSDKGSIRFESLVRAWFLPIWEVRECTPESLETLGAPTGISRGPAALSSQGEAGGRA